MSDTRLAALEAAFAEVGDGNEEEAPEPVTEAPEPAAEPVEADAPDAPAPLGAESETTDATKAERARDQTGRFTKAPKAEKPSQTAAPKAQEAAGATKPPAPGAKAPSTTAKPEAAAQAAPTAPQAKAAPPGWSPQAREHWGKLPQEVREDVWRRERETSQALRESSEARQFHQAFSKMAQPYEGVFRAEGVDALKAAGNLFQAVAVLQQGPAAAKAQMVAAIAKTYGVDPDLLTQAYNGQPMPNQGQSGPVDPATIAAQVRQQVMADFQAQREHAFVQRASSEVETFGEGREFFEDVRPIMAVILDSATASKQAMSLDQAYKMALQFHPGASSVLKAREAAGTARNAQASTERARAAASSVRSQPVSAPRSQRDYSDRMSAIEAAWEESTSR